MYKNAPVTPKSYMWEIEQPQIQKKKKKEKKNCWQNWFFLAKANSAPHYKDFIYNMGHAI